MARVTVEDCILKVDNRFDLIVLAAHRGREITAGSELTVPRDNDKNPVVSLREIADETIEVSDLKESMVASLQTQLLDDDQANKDEEDTQIHSKLLSDHSSLRHNFDGISSKLKETSKKSPVPASSRIFK